MIDTTAKIIRYGVELGKEGVRQRMRSGYYIEYDLTAARNWLSSREMLAEVKKISGSLGLRFNSLRELTAY